MKTLYLTTGSGMYIDTENDTVNSAHSEVERISRVYLMTEPTHIVFGEGEYHRELDAKKDDIVIVFYNKVDFKEQIIIAKSKDWAANIKEYNNAEQARKEEWAKNANNLKKCCDLGDAETCCPA